MNIRYLNELIHSTEEIAKIGKYAEIHGVVCNIMGAVRTGLQLKLLILQYDGDFQQNLEEYEASLYEVPDKPDSNRNMLSGKQRHIDASNPFRAVRKIFIGNREFEVRGMESRRLGMQDWRELLMISEFLRKGWKPDGIEFQSIDMLFLTSLELDGEYTAIPDFGDNPELRFAMGPDSVSYMVEQPITLAVDGEYRDKLWFRDLSDGKEYWFMINRMYLLDMWAEIEKNFNHPKIQEQMTLEQIARAKADFEEKFSKICPRGMLFPVVEYECEEGISLQFYTKSYLEAKPANKNCAIGFIVRPEQSTGILGLKLKSAIIQEPVPPDTVSIEAELFQYIRTITGDDIVLK